MTEAIKILEGLLPSVEIPNKDASGVYIPLNVDENLRLEGVQRCIDELKRHEHRP
jgi:hypothetical protein